MADKSIFLESVASRHSMFPGSGIGMSPNLNIASLPGGSGPAGMLAQMFLEPTLQGMLGPGFVPGQFNQTHNLYDHYRRRAQFQAMQASMSAAAESDQQQYVALLRGMAAAAGVSWTDDRERAARAMAQDMGKISPMLAQIMPDTFDRMHGGRGSAVIMAQGMFAGGRYRLDPVTGMLGMSGDSVTQVNRELYDRLYGPGADLTAMRGLGAGRAGQLFDEMSRRGMMPRALSRPEQLREIAARDLRGRGADTDAEAMANAIGELRDLASPQLEAKIRQLEASRVGDRVKSMAGAVAAMKDVFGEMGRPDAPMSELIEGLQVLTQGGLATMTPGRVEGLVRDAANLARRTGMGMDNMTMLMATAAQRADAMGLDRGFGVTAGLQAAAFGSAYANTVGGAPAWGRGDRERMVAIDSQLRLNAADSQVANQLAATVRLGRDVGFKEGSEADAAYRAVQAGQKTYTFEGQTRSVYADPGRWRDVMAAGGVDAGLAAAYRGQTAFNQKTVDDAGLTGLARELQADVDVAPRLNRAYQRAARQAGITDPALLGLLGDSAAAGLLGDLPAEALQDPARVAEFLAGRAGVAANDPRMEQVRRAALLGWGEVEQMVKTNPRLRGYKSADQFVMSHRRGTHRETAAQVEEAQQESRLQSALAGMGSGGPLERLVDAVAGATPDTPFADLAKATLGWIPEGEVGKRLEGTVREMQAEIKKFRETDPAAVGREARTLDKRRLENQAKARALHDQAQALAGESAATRVGGVTPGQREEARRQQALEAQLVRDGQGQVAELTRLERESGGTLRVERDEATGRLRVVAGAGADPARRAAAEELAGHLSNRAEMAAQAAGRVRAAAKRAGLSVGALVGGPVPADVQAEARAKRDELTESRTHMHNANVVFQALAVEKYGDNSAESVAKVMSGRGLTESQRQRFKTALEAHDQHSARAAGHAARLDELIRVHGYGSATYLYGDPDRATREAAQRLEREGKTAELTQMAKEKTGGDVDVLLGRKAAAGSQPPPTGLNRIEAALADPAMPEPKKAELRRLRDEMLAAQRAEIGDQEQLQGLADRYTGGDRDALLSADPALRRRIREDALRKIRAMSPELRRQAEAAGLELGAVATGGDAARAWGALRDGRTAAGVLETDALAEKVLHDDRAMGVLGAGGLALVTRVQGRNRRLRALADRFAGGDVGVLTATEAQRKRAREALGEVTKGAAESRRLEAEVEAAENKGDIEAANAKRAELEKVNREVTAAQNRLTAVGAEAGTDGERLARAGAVDAAAQKEAGVLREAQMADARAIETRLRAGKKGDLSAEEKAALAAERGARQKGDGQVVDDLLRTLGVDKQVSAADRTAVAQAALRGDRGYAIRAALPALQRLREMKKDMSADQFQDYLARGAAGDASAEERELYARVSAGRAGGGLAGIGRAGATREAILKQLRDFAPDQRDGPEAATAGRGRPGGAGPTEITGTLTIPGLGEGRLAARGARK